MKPERKNTQFAIIVPCYKEGEMLGISVPRLVAIVDDLLILSEDLYASFLRLVSIFSCN